jgi:hypothetical protein
MWLEAQIYSLVKKANAFKWELKKTGKRHGLHTLNMIIESEFILDIAVKMEERNGCGLGGGYE